MVLMAAIFFMAVTAVFAEKTSVENLYQYTLDNGLTVFEVENHAVPLVYIEIAVRAGAKDQTPETAGLFHLYEHMMFKGNALYKDAAEVQHALSELGVTNWNGTTGIDCVNYFFTIPSDRIEDGLAFWNAAIRSPNMDRNEFENEKKVVLSEIEGDIADPSHIYMNTMNSQLFPEAPYRLSPGGSTPVVKNATLDQLLDIKEKFYIPANSALFIGGDIDPEETFRLVEKIWGSWSNNGMAVPKPQAELTKNPFSKTTAMVMPYDQMSPQIASVSISYRGPDTDFDLEDTYAADYFCQLNIDPQGTLIQTLYSKKDLMIPGTEYIGQSYNTVRQSGGSRIDVDGPILQTILCTRKFYGLLVSGSTTPTCTEVDEGFVVVAIVSCWFRWHFKIGGTIVGDRNSLWTQVVGDGSEVHPLWGIITEWEIRLPCVGRISSCPALDLAEETVHGFVLATIGT